MRPEEYEGEQTDSRCGRCGGMGSHVCVASPLEDMATRWWLNHFGGSKLYKYDQLGISSLTILLAHVQREERERAKRIVQEEQQIALQCECAGEYCSRTIADAILRRLDEENGGSQAPAAVMSARRNP